jgi:peptidoglycan/LPS O-acetylase OafA/YrhL
MNIKTSTYRPDIDGLRAIAVLAVVFYHAGIAGFSGGYVGVDVFFVISGYLITRLLIAETDSNNNINLGNFYLRRIRRLLPAFAFTAIYTSIIAIWLFSPQELESYGAALLHSVLSISNIYFYTESGYFDSSSKLNPLLHTWTLSVEEQFYMVWPILLLLAASKKWIAPVSTVILGLTSLYFAQKYIEGYTAAVFYLMPFRIFEFAIGASLVWISRIQFNLSSFKEPLLLFGLILIIYSVFKYNEQTLFPGLSALIPCLGAAMCIYAGDAKYTGKLLNNKLFISIGLISYSLYLAHWPVIVFYKKYIGNDELTRVDKVIVLLASCLIAIFMYFFIEKPFRKPKISSNPFLICCVIISFLLTYIGASMWATNGWDWRSWSTTRSISAESIKRGKEFRFHVRQKLCEVKGWAECDEPVKGRINALIIGDSHAVDALNAFEKIFPNQEFSMSELGGCPPYWDIEKITMSNHPDRLKCKELNKNRYDPKYLNNFDYIIINVLFGWYTSEHLNEYLEFLKINNIKKVIVLGDYLNMTRDMSELINSYGFNKKEIERWINKNTFNELELATIVNKFGYYFLSKRETFCQKNICELFDNNHKPYSYDKNHLSYEFAARLAIKQKNSIENYLGLLGRP